MRAVDADTLHAEPLARHDRVYAVRGYVYIVGCLDDARRSELVANAMLVVKVYTDPTP